MATPIIAFREAELGYGRQRIIHNLTLEIYRSDFLGIVGPNGSGKTTIVRAILGLLQPLRGEIRRGDGSESSLRYGYVPQRESLETVLPFTVGDVVGMGRYFRTGIFRKQARSKDREAVTSALRQTGILELARRPYRELSGGQKQRTLIARALAGEPDILLLDEPTNGMDLASRTSIMQLIRNLHTEGRLTVVMVSHLLSDVANDAGRLALVEGGLVQTGATNDILTARTLSALYGIQVDVAEMKGTRVIIAGGKHV